MDLKLIILKVSVNIADFSCVIFWAKTVPNFLGTTVLPDQNVLVLSDHNVSIFLISNMYNFGSENYAQSLGIV